MKLKSLGAIHLWLLPSMGALWLGSIRTVIEITRMIEGAPDYSPWDLGWSTTTMLVGIVMTAWCWLNLKNCKEEEPPREQKHYQLAHTRLFTLAGCGYLEKDPLKRTNMALRINEVTCTDCIMDVWEGVITVNKLAPEPIEIDKLIASTPADHRISMPGAL